LRALVVAGTRPEFIKLAPVIKELRARSVDVMFVASGQHYDYELSRVFLEEFGLGEPDIWLTVGGKPDYEILAETIKGVARIVEEREPDIVIAEGDTSTCAGAALASVKTQVPFAHVEAGLRSFDYTMPEELNRRIADHCGLLLFAPTEQAVINLKCEGIPPDRIYLTGNTIVDALIELAPKAVKCSDEVCARYDLSDFILITIHRAETVDRLDRLQKVVSGLKRLSRLGVQLAIPLHPRTRKRLIEFELWNTFAKIQNLKILPPLGYIEFLALLLRCRFVITDSGGIQEETAILRIPCITFRRNTERPETVREQVNVLVDHDPDVLFERSKNLLHKDRPRPRVPQQGQQTLYGDGQAAMRIAEVLIEKVDTLEYPSPLYLKLGAPMLRMEEIKEKIRFKRLLLDVKAVEVFDNDGNPLPVCANIDSEILPGSLVKVMIEQ